MSQPHEQAMIERWKELDEKATEGPWYARTRSGCYAHLKTRDGTYVAEPAGKKFAFRQRRDAELIAFLRNHSAKLRRVVEAAKKVCSNYLTGLPDDDPRKGAGNYLADALEELER